LPTHPETPLQKPLVSEIGEDYDETDKIIIPRAVLAGLMKRAPPGYTNPRAAWIAKKMEEHEQVVMSRKLLRELKAAAGA
jgi:hypothetical protein